MNNEQERIEYGKIKNNELIIADRIIVVDGIIQLISEEDLQKSGYKRIIYRDLPHNKDGFIPKVTWEETPDCIIQNWVYDRIPTDKSGELLVAVRCFDQKLRFSIECLENSYEKNSQLIDDLVNNNPLIKDIIVKANALGIEGIVSYLHKECDFNLNSFFLSLGLLEEYGSKGFVSNESALTIGETIIPIMYFKSSLSRYESLKNFSTIENHAAYDMAYIFSYTLFDEVLLKIDSIT